MKKYTFVLECVRKPNWLIQLLAKLFPKMTVKSKMITYTENTEGEYGTTAMKRAFERARADGYIVLRINEVIN